MQKKLIALAVAGLGLTASAFAQTNVTIYGIVDETFGATKAIGSATGDKLNTIKLDSNSSYVGFKGTEDLGDGLSAIFQIESGFAGDTAGALAGGRDTFVGLKSGWGTVRLGNFTGPTRAIGTTLDLLPGRDGIGTSNSIIGRGITGTGATATLFDTRTPNTIQYASPNFEGFRVAVDYAAGENRNLSNAAPSSQANDKLWELGLTYANGPWYVGYAYGKNDYGTASAATIPLAVANANALQTWTSNRLGAGYTFTEGHKINLIWDKQKQELLNTGGVLNANSNFEKTSWSLQGLFKVSAPGSLIVAYSKSNDASGSFLPATTLKTNSETGAKEFTIGYLHALSKRTTLKAIWTKISNDNNVAYDFAGNAVGGGFGLGADPQGIAVGIRHAF